MIRLKKFNFNPLQVNNYILYDESKECVIIDATCYFENEKNELAEFIRSEQLKPVKLISTHCHFDHVVANKYLVDLYKIPILAHKADEFLLTDVVHYSTVFGMRAEESPKISQYVDENDIISFGNSQLKILHLPGHSPGSIGIYNSVEKMLFSGDTLFAGSVGRTDLPGGSQVALFSSIKDKLYKLDFYTNVYPGHGESTTIGHEVDNNPFVR